MQHRVGVDIRIRFGLAVRKRRSELGISQEKLAERADLHRTYIADIEGGKRNVSLVAIEKVAKGLQLSIAKLFLERGSMSLMTTSSTITKGQSRQDAEIRGNNVAVMCPIPGCGQVFIASGFPNHKDRTCPRCGESRLRLVMDGTKISHAILELD